MAQTILDRDSPLYCCPNKESRHGRLALCALYQPATPDTTPSRDYAPKSRCVYAISQKGISNIIFATNFMLPLI